jgi:hypothetical protein
MMEMWRMDYHWEYQGAMQVVKFHVGKTPIPEKQFLLGRCNVLVDFICDGQVTQLAGVTLTLALFPTFLTGIWLFTLLCRYRRRTTVG